MSSKDKERVIEEMWQKEKMFDELLALILQGTYMYVYDLVVLLLVTTFSKFKGNTCMIFKFEYSS